MLGWLKKGGDAPNQKNSKKRKLPVRSSPSSAKGAKKVVKKRKLKGSDDDDDDDFVPDVIEEDEDYLDEDIEEEKEEFVEETFEEDEEDKYFKKSTKSSKSTKATSKAASNNAQPKKLFAKKLTNGKNGEEQRYPWMEDVRDIKKRRPTDPDYDPTSLYIPEFFFQQKFTPFEIQYWKVKQQYFDTVVFFKKGKFYELYENDADIGLKEFDLKMTDRVNMRMVGIPEQSLYQWAGRFLAKGYKITLVDQAETKRDMDRRVSSKTTKEDKLIRREVSRILTQGTLVEEEFTADYNSHYLIAIKEVIHTSAPSDYGICVIDCGVSKLWFGVFTDDDLHSKLETLLLQLKPKEILLEKDGFSERTKFLLDHRLSSPVVNILTKDEFAGDFSSLKKLFCKYNDSIQILDFIQNLQHSHLLISSFIATITYLEKLKVAPMIIPSICIEGLEKAEQECMLLDAQTLLNLEILENMSDRGKEGTLLHILDNCCTSFGRRMLRKWVYRPLFNEIDINQRLDAIQYLNSPHVNIKSEFQSAVKGLCDLERMIPKLKGIQRVKVKDLVIALNSFETLLNFVKNIAEPIPTSCALLHSLLTIDSSGGMFPEIEQELMHFKASFDFKTAIETNAIEPRPGMDDVYDDAIKAIEKIKARLDSERIQLSKKMKIPIRYVDKGKEKYQLEMNKSDLGNVTIPSTFRIVTETKTCRRYYTPEVLSILSQFPDAEEQLNTAKEGILLRYLQRFNAYGEKWQQIVSIIAQLDCLISLANVSAHSLMCRPSFVSSLLLPFSEEKDKKMKTAAIKDGGAYINVEDMRHPILSNNIGAEFVPNSLTMGDVDHPERVILLTGPNMGGKSTLLRQIALIIIMAQIGCFVPASRCALSIYDRIFTRIGASDNIFEGQSTFLVELQETSTILKESTNKSLIILDELGRGTSTYDGYSIAYATLYHLAQFSKSAVLFSTHYHLLTDELQLHPNISLNYMSCYIDDELMEVVYLYKMKNGVCPKSYGMNVAKVAGIPQEILDSAQIVSKQFEAAQPIQKYHINLLLFKTLLNRIEKFEHNLDLHPLLQTYSKIKSFNSQQ